MSLYTRFELRQRARPHLEWLCRETEETVQLQTPHGEKVLVLDTVSPEVSFYLRVVPGSHVFYHPNAFGKAILAFMTEEEVKAILPSKLPALTPHTVTLLRELLLQLEETRRTGLAYDNEEYTSGIVCIGSPVFDVQGEVVAGLGITAIASLFNPKQRAAFQQLVLECAYRVSKSIGYSGDYFSDKVGA
jgi:IclR family acetate operon transcriptional repressor